MCSGFVTIVFEIYGQKKFFRFTDFAPSGARLRRVPTKINSPIVVFATRFVTKIVFYERDYVNSSYRNYEEDNSVFCNVNVEPLW